LQPSKAFATRASSNRLRLTLLSQSLEVGADRAEILKVLGFQFRHFRSTTAGRRPPDHRIILRLEKRRPGLTVDGVHRAIPPEALQVRHGMSLVLEAMLDGIRSHLLFHAGVVSRGQRGLLICGPAGFGKTSLILELALRGFGFLSDDYAPVALDSGLVAPFPRSMGIVASPRNAAGRLRRVPRSKRLLFDGKWLVDPTGLPGLRLAGPCRPDLVLLLGPATRSRHAAASLYEISITPDRVEELRRRFPEIPFLKRRSSRPPLGAVFRFHLPKEAGCSTRLEQWAYANRASVFSLTRLFSRSGAFRPPLRIQRVAPRDGLIETLGDLQNRRPVPDSQGQGSASPALLLLQAASLLGRCEFYRFEGGNLQARAEAAAELLSRGAGRP
jgi:hypothetical protein